MTLGSDMAKYCLDTSGFSNPLMDLPSDIHVTLWAKIQSAIENGIFCWNVEISVELESIFGDLGERLAECNGDCCLEIGQDGWPWEDYLVVFEALKTKYQKFISEYNGNRKNTVGVNDISIIALAKVLKLPVMSMEIPTTNLASEKRLRIPDVCKLENVVHLTFNDFLRAEGITS